MKLTVDINLRLCADDTLVRLLTDVLASRTTPAPVTPAPTHLPRPEPEPEPEPVLPTLGPPRDPTPIPEHLHRSTLHPVTQEALAAMDDAHITQRTLDAAARRDQEVFAKRDRKPVDVAKLTPAALAVPKTMTVPAPDGVEMRASDCAACGTSFSYPKTKGRPRSKCEACR